MELNPAPLRCQPSADLLSRSTLPKPSCPCTHSWQGPSSCGHKGSNNPLVILSNKWPTAHSSAEVQILSKGRLVDLFP